MTDKIRRDNDRERNSDGYGNDKKRSRKTISKYMLYQNNKEKVSKKMSWEKTFQP